MERIIIGILIGVGFVLVRYFYVTARNKKSRDEDRKEDEKNSDSE